MHAFGVADVIAAGPARLGGGSRTSRLDEPLFADVLGSVRASTGTLAGVLSTGSQRVQTARREREVGQGSEPQSAEARPAKAAAETDSAEPSSPSRSRAADEATERPRAERQGEGQTDSGSVQQTQQHAVSEVPAQPASPSAQANAGQVAASTSAGAASPPTQQGAPASMPVTQTTAGTTWTSWQQPQSIVQPSVMTGSTVAGQAVAAAATGAVQSAGQATGTAGAGAGEAQGGGDFRALVAKLGGRQLKADKAAATDVRSSEGLQELARLVKTQLGQKRSSLTVHLSPAELGRVRVKVDMQDGLARVELTAETPEARDVLRKQLNELRGALEQQGIRVESLDVQLRPAEEPSNGRGFSGQGGEQAGWAGAQGGFGQTDQAGGEGEQGGYRYTAGRRADASGEAQPVGLGSPWRLSETGVDLMA